MKNLYADKIIKALTENARAFKVLLTQTLTLMNLTSNYDYLYFVKCTCLLRIVLVTKILAYLHK